MRGRRRFTFEVVRFVRGRGEYEHIGYMKASFATRHDAETCYNTSNPRMRPLSADSTWISDVHHETGLMYILREDYGIRASVDEFHARAHSRL